MAAKQVIPSDVNVVRYVEHAGFQLSPAAAEGAGRAVGQPASGISTCTPSAEDAASPLESSGKVSQAGEASDASLVASGPSSTSAEKASLQSLNSFSDQSGATFMQNVMAILGESSKPRTVTEDTKLQQAKVLSRTPRSSPHVDVCEGGLSGRAEDQALLQRSPHPGAKDDSVLDRSPEPCAQIQMAARCEGSPILSAGMCSVLPVADTCVDAVQPVPPPSPAESTQAERGFPSLASLAKHALDDGHLVSQSSQSVSISSECAANILLGDTYVPSVSGSDLEERRASNTLARSSANGRLGIHPSANDSIDDVHLASQYSRSEMTLPSVSAIFPQLPLGQTACASLAEGCVSSRFAQCGSELAPIAEDAVLDEAPSNGCHPWIQDPSAASADACNVVQSRANEWHVWAMHVSELLSTFSEELADVGSRLECINRRLDDSRSAAVAINTASSADVLSIDARLQDHFNMACEQQFAKLMPRLEAMDRRLDSQGSIAESIARLDAAYSAARAQGGDSRPDVALLDFSKDMANEAMQNASPFSTRTLSEASPCFVRNSELLDLERLWSIGASSGKNDL